MDIAKMMLEKLGDHFKQMLKDNLNELGDLKLASACTGSNVTRVVCEHFFAGLLGTKVVEVYCCEKDKKKQDFINWTCKQLGDEDTCVFTDISTFLGPDACCCVHDEAGCEVPLARHGLGLNRAVQHSVFCNACGTERAHVSGTTAEQRWSECILECSQLRLCPFHCPHWLQLQELQ